MVASEPCVYCLGHAHGLDHIVPRSKGGRNAWENRAPACRHCDSHKQNDALLLFLTRRARALRPNPGLTFSLGDTFHAAL